MARPSKYDPKFATKLVTHCSNGYSFETFAHKIGVTDRTLRNWQQRFPDFAEAAERAKIAAMYFFEHQLIQGITGKGDTVDKKNTSLLIFALKTRFSKQYSQQMKIATQERIDVHVPGSFEFKGRRVTVAEVSFDELDEATKELKIQTAEVQARIKRLETEPDPLDEWESSFL